MNVNTELIAPGRCTCCGHKVTTWSPQQICDALHAWADAHDGFPPNSGDWRKGTPEHPACSTVQEIFGSWDNGLTAAGLKKRARGSRHGWTRDTAAEAMLDWLLLNGRWPTYREWYTPGLGEHPHAAIVIRLFGSWNKGKRYAGWDGQGRRNPKPADFADNPVAVCVGCGGDVESAETLGCRTCWDRKHTRELRAAQKNGLALGVVESPNPTGDSDAEADGNAVLPGQSVNHVAQAA